MTALAQWFKQQGSGQDYAFIDYAKAIPMYKSGMTIGRVAKKLNCSAFGLRKGMIKRGVVMRQERGRWKR